MLDAINASSYTELERQSGVSRTTLWRIMNDKLKDTNLQTASKIFFGVEKILKKS